ncbi:MAG: orotate phosphoribosyltransferase [Candidatus Micrarchaeia archaeon]
MEKKIINEIYDYGLFLTLRNKREGWTLADGSWSPFYINLRPLPSFPDLFADVTRAFCEMLRKENISAENGKIVGIATAGIPIASGVGISCSIPVLYTRKLPDNVNKPSEALAYLEHHGQHSVVEGVLCENDRLYLFDDVVTSFVSKELAIEQVKYQAKSLGLKNVKIEGVYVIIDRTSKKAKEEIEKTGIGLKSITHINTILDVLRDKLSYDEIKQIKSKIGE